MEQINTMYPENRSEMYSLLKAQLKAMLEGEPHVIANLSNVSALICGALQNINWVGFYLMHNGELLLGPFQGKPACVHIAVGKGVCGTAASLMKTQVVEDVHQFPGHIACDSDSASEIVVPLRVQGRIIGVLDIDSPSVARFDNEDARELEQIAALLETACNWAEWNIGE
jgi:GAF domain-containing protein